MISCKPCISNTSRHRSTRRKTAPRRFKAAQQLHSTPVTTTVIGFALFYRFSVLLDFPTDFPTSYFYACFCSVAMINLAISGFSCSSRYACSAVLSNSVAALSFRASDRVTGVGIRPFLCGETDCRASLYPKGTCFAARTGSQ